MVLDIDPVIFSIGPISVRYYGLIYMSAFVLGYFFLRFFIKNYKILPGITLKNLEDYVFFVILSVILGARLFEVLFYNLEYFLSYPLKIFAVWEGGLSFHGGFAGFLVYSFYFTKKHKLPLFLWLDFCAIPAAFGLFLGRIANFINGELYGYPVANQIDPPFWAILFKNTDPLQLYRYPTQLMESFSNFMTFIILTIIFIKFFKAGTLDKNRGILSAIFCLCYGIFRFIVEYFKDYEQDIFLSLSMGQLLCLPVIIGGIIIYIVSKRKLL